LKGGDTTPNDDSAVYRGGTQIVREGQLYDSYGQNEPKVGDLFAFEGLAPETARRAFPFIDAPTWADTGFPISDLSRVAEGAATTDAYLLGDVRDARLLLFPRSPHVIFRGTITGVGGAQLPNNQRIFVRPFLGSSEERAQVIARQGEAPINATDLRIESFYHPATGLIRSGGSDLPSVLYAARLSGANVTSSNDSAILTGRVLSLREGSQVPGAPPGVVFGDLGTDNIVGGGRSGMMFNNQLNGSGISEGNDWALMGSYVNVFSARITRVLAQEGQTVSGLPAGSVLADLDAPHFQFNLDGQAIFNAQFIGPNGNGAGLFYASVAQAEPSLIVRTGQDIDIGGGMFKTISDIGLMEVSNPWDGRASQINDAGQITFSLTFTDGSQGIFVATVPEPGTVALAATAVVVVCAVAGRRRRQRM
jgi:hypothetical protein